MRLLLLQFVIVALASSARVSQAQPWFQPLEPEEGHTNPNAHAISADGLYVVGEQDFNGDHQAFRWSRAGGYKHLGDLPGGAVSSRGFGVSAHGLHIVGDSEIDLTTEGYRWVNGGMIGIGFFHNGSDSSASAISPDGSVLTGSGYDYVEHHAEAFRSVRGGPLERLGRLGDGTSSSVAGEMSADGSIIIGTSEYSQGTLAFRWTRETGMVSLGDLSGGDYGGGAGGISADGSIIVGSSPVAGGPEAFRWTHATGMMPLGYPVGDFTTSSASDCSGDASVVVGYATSNILGLVATIWDAKHGMRQLRDVLVSMGVSGLDGWKLNSARCISGDGLTIVGNGTNPDGHVQSWVAYLGQPVKTTTERVSIGADEQQGTGGSTLGSVSSDGQVVAFWSGAPNLVAGDTNGRIDVFVRNRAAAWTTRVSVSTAGLQGNGDSTNGQVSANGRFVVFSSDATNLVAGDTNGKRDIFIRDRVALTTQRLSISSGGAQANGASDLPRISADGRFVVYQSDATTLVGGDTNQLTDVFLRDRQSGQTVRVSLTGAGFQGNGRSYDPTVSNDGATIAFTSAASNLVTGDTNASPDVFFRNRPLNSTVRASLSSDNGQGNLASAGARISANGRYIAFTSSATNLVVGDSNNADDVLVRDRFNSTTVRINLAPAQANLDSAVAAISADGRYVLYTSQANNLVAGDTNSANDAFLHDGCTFLTQRVSVGLNGQQASSACVGTSLSADGRFAVFNSLTGNLVPGDTNGKSDVFLRDLRKPN